MSIKKKIKRKSNRIKEAKKAGAVSLPSSKSKQDTSGRRKKGPVKLRGLVAHPGPATVDWRLEQARLQGMRDAFQTSSVGLLANAVGGFVNGLNSCPNCDEPLPNGRYRIKCKCGYCRIGNTKELNSGMLITGMFAAAFGALAALLTLNDLEKSKKESEPKLPKLLPQRTGGIGENWFDVDFDNPKNHQDNVIQIKPQSKDDKDKN